MAGATEIPPTGRQPDEVPSTSAGRSEEQKRARHAGLAKRLEEATGLAPSDLIVSVMGGSPEGWSFGLGRAQFLEGDL